MVAAGEADGLAGWRSVVVVVVWVGAVAVEADHACAVGR